MKRLALLPAVALLGCPAPADPGPCGLADAPGVVDGARNNPFPSVHMEREFDGACRLDLHSEDVPVGDSDPFVVEGINRRDGFSPVGTIVLKPGVALDGTALPSKDDIAESMADGATVQLWDLDAGVRLPHFAELDAYPEQDDASRALLIRPMAPMPWGARVAVVLVDLPTLDGGVWSGPAPFAELRDGEGDEVLLGHYGRLLDRLGELGVARESVALAWDFHVGTRDNLLAPLNRVLDTVRAAVPLDPKFEPVITVTSIREAGTDTPPPEGLWREVRGSVRLPHFLWPRPGDDDADNGWFQLDDGGLPLVNGDAEAFFTLAVPMSLQGAAANSAPLLVFGHGIFSAPANYIAAPGDPNGAQELLNRLGAVGIGTEWRGLTARDRPDSIRAATNLSQFPLITDKLQQGVANQAVMARLLKTAFVDHEIVAGDNGPLLDPERALYYGISLGGIEGAVLLAVSEVLQFAALHVPGSMWATMLERSANWEPFEGFVLDVSPVAADRQMLYAATQLLWDPIDPALHTEALAERSALWSVSIGDEQVPNFTAEALARGVGVPVLGPTTQPVWGLDVVTGPLPPGSSALIQFDGDFPAPPDGNRPADVTGAHDGIRRTPELLEQLEVFFEPGAEGTIINPCGGACFVEPAR